MSQTPNSKQSPEEDVTAVNMSTEAEQALQQLTSELDLYKNELVNSFNISSKIEDSLQELSLLLDIYDGTFTLLLARCNYVNLRDRAIARLSEILSTPMRQVCLEPTTKSIYQAINSSTPAMREGNLPAVMVTGLEATEDPDILVKGLNQIREEFRKNCLYPIVLWINDDLLKRMIRIAPDFESWTTTIEFEIASEDLISSIASGTEALFHLALSANLIDPSHSLGRVSHLGGIYLTELDVARRDLRNQGIQISASLQAGLDFIRGMNTRDCLQSLSYFKASYKYWETVGNIERQGLLLYQIGRRRFHLTKLEKHSHEENWHTVEKLFAKSLDCFKRVDRFDLMSQCYLQVQRTLHHLKAWTELKSVSQKAIEIHQTHGDAGNLAADYGFLAEAALEQKEWEIAKQYAQQAIALLEDAPKTLHWLYGLYLCYLAEAQIQLGDLELALTNLIDAKSRDHCGHPRMYIRILNELRNLHFSQGQYLEAFQTKQESLAIEQRYGYRAFIGAGQLQSCLEEHSSFVDKNNKFIISPEIYASGRKQDLDELTNRLGEPRYKMIVLHGNSGVGKSSFINAGLLPALQQASFGGRDVMPISMRVYTSWEQELINLLTESLNSSQLTSSPLLSFTNSKPNSEDFTKEQLCDRIIEQLRWNEAHNLRTVLIFDQFEEFFFIYQRSTSDRLRFFEFIGSLLSDFQYLSSIKIVLSLREDYIHCLLECNRVKGMSAIDNDILSKNVLYPLGNFSPEAAYSTIETLTERAQFYLESQLINILVEDLKNEQDEIRPIELQIVGAQLQSDRISTIQQYQKLGNNPKETLVQRYLDNVVLDCGKENYRLAKLILYLLTDEKGTRPLKTYEDLERGLNHLDSEVRKQSKLDAGFDTEVSVKLDIENDGDIEISQIELVLQILIGSGLVVLIPENATNRCQLVHDYLAVVIRKSQAPEIQKLQKELEKTQGELRQTVRQLESSFKNSQAIADSLSLNSLLTNDLVDLDELAKSMAIAKEWLPNIEAIASENRLQLASTIYRAIYEIKEKNRIEAHIEGVWSAEFSPDGSQIVTGGLDNVIKLWQTNGQEILQITGHTAAIRSASFSPDGQTILSSSSDKTISLWNLQGDRLNTLTGHTAAVWSAQFSPNGEMIVSGSGDQTIKLWHRDGTEIITLSGHRGDVRAAIFSPNGEWIISGGADKNIMIWSLDGTLLQTLKGHSADIRCISISPNGEFIASGSGDNILKLWHVQIDREHGEKPIAEVFSIEAHSSAIRSVNFSPDGTLLATGSADRNIKLWNLHGDKLQIFKGHTDPIRSVSFSPDGKTLLSASLDSTVRQWQIESRAQQTLSGHSAAVRSVAFSPDGLRIASGSLDDQIKIWDLQGSELQTIVSDNDILSLSFSPDGNHLLVGSGDSVISLFDLSANSHQLLQTFTGHSTAVWTVDFSADGQKIVSGSSDKSVKLWQIDGTELATLKGHKSTVWTVRFSPDGQKIISGSGDDTIKLWNIDGTELQTLRGHRGAVWSVCFSPDGQHILSGSGDSTLKLWSLNGQLLQTFRGHDAGIWTVSFSPDGRSIISGSSDNTIKLWSIDGKELQTFPCPDSTPISLCFRPDGHGFTSGHGSNVIGLWNLDLANLITQGDAWLQNYC
jgi:WD40 repeat protein